jgi:hypothetical protein
MSSWLCPLGKKRGSLAPYLFEYAAFFLWAFVRVLLLMQHRRYVVIDVSTLPDFPAMLSQETRL